MTEQMELPIASEADTTETIYRSRAVPLFDEEESVPENERNRTRVSARFSRDSWSAETYHPFEHEVSPYARKTINHAFASQSFGSLESQAHTTVKSERRKRSRAVQKQPVVVHTRESLATVQMHGDYRFHQIVVLETGKSRLRVEAVCTAGFCDGTLRVFRADEWMRVEECTACPRCKRTQQVNARAEAIDPKKRHGLYEFVALGQKSAKEPVTRVIGRCTGPRCDGALRHFTMWGWNDSDEGEKGCRKCSKIDYTRSAVASLSKLDAAANEMRRMGDVA